MIATGDFNGDGIRDFAVVVIDRTKAIHQFSLLVFNGPFNSEPVEPTFVASGLDLRYMGLCFRSATAKTISAHCRALRNR